MGTHLPNVGACGPRCGYREVRPMERRFLLELTIPMPITHLVLLQLKIEMVVKKTDSHSA
jgi:hypothetical protein